MTAGPDKPATITLATMERLASLDAGDAVKMQIDAQQRRQAAVHMQERGDRIGPKYELAEAKRLEHEAELTLDPAMHCTGPVTVGNGGEMVIGPKAMRPFVNTVTERPGMLAMHASTKTCCNSGSWGKKLLRLLVGRRIGVGYDHEPVALIRTGLKSD